MRQHQAQATWKVSCMASLTSKARLIDATRDNEKNCSPQSPLPAERLVGTLQETNHGHAGWRAKMIIGALEPVKKYGAE